MISHLLTCTAPFACLSMPENLKIFDNVHEASRIKVGNAMLKSLAAPTF